MNFPVNMPVQNNSFQRNDVILNPPVISPYFNNRSLQEENFKTAHLNNLNGPTNSTQTPGLIMPLLLIGGIFAFVAFSRNKGIITSKEKLGKYIDSLSSMSMNKSIDVFSLNEINIPFHVESFLNSSKPNIKPLKKLYQLTDSEIEQARNSRTQEVRETLKLSKHFINRFLNNKFIVPKITIFLEEPEPKHEQALIKLINDISNQNSAGKSRKIYDLPDELLRLVGRIEINYKNKRILGSLLGEKDPVMVNIVSPTFFDEKRVNYHPLKTFFEYYLGL